MRSCELIQFNVLSLGYVLKFAAKNARACTVSMFYEFVGSILCSRRAWIFARSAYLFVWRLSRISMSTFTSAQMLTTVKFIQMLFGRGKKAITHSAQMYTQ